MYHSECHSMKKLSGLYIAWMKLKIIECAYAIPLDHWFVTNKATLGIFTYLTVTPGILPFDSIASFICARLFIWSFKNTNVAFL